MVRNLSRKSRAVARAAVTRFHGAAASTNRKSLIPTAPLSAIGKLASLSTGAIRPVPAALGATACGGPTYASHLQSMVGVETGDSHTR